MPRNFFARVAMCLVLTAALNTSSASALNNDITRASVSAAGLQGDGASDEPSVSSDGQTVAFSSDASNITGSDSNHKKDIFVKARGSGVVTKLTAGDDNSSAPSISQDAGARYVAFESTSTRNLVNIITNGTNHIYLNDRTGPTTTLISKQGAGTPGNGDSSHAGVSSSGALVAFQSAATNLTGVAETLSFTDVYLYNAANVGNEVTRISNTPGSQEPNGPSTAPSISADGRFIVFESAATNLLSTADSNGFLDVFIYDGNSQIISLVSKQFGTTASANGDSTAPVVSADGTVVVFESSAKNLVSGDTVSKTGVFAYDVVGGTVTLISKNPGGQKCNGNSSSPSVSGDGRYVAFISECSDLIDGDNNAAADLFVFDRNNNQIVDRRNLSISKLQSTGGISGSSVSNNGSIVAFGSDAKDLVRSDTNDVSDVFVTDTNCPTDSDADATVDCSDGCPFDAAKTAAGVCGCGTSDADDDGDGAALCNDECPSDPLKQAVGQCGCGVADTDANGNSVADCNDPTNSSKPVTPLLTVNSKTSQVRSSIPTQFSHVTYKIQFLKGNTVLANLSCTSKRATFSNLSKGTYKMKYRVKLGAVLTKYSNTRSISVPTGKSGKFTAKCG